jgi:hypothetical protein
MVTIVVGFRGGPREVTGSALIFSGERDSVNLDYKTPSFEGFVAALAKATQISDVPDEAITTDTREPSYMFLAAEWNRSSISERAYLLAMLFGREFDVDANALSLQIASIGEPDGSALTARADLGMVSDEDVPRTVAAD